MAQVIWTIPALNDLDGIADYIALDNPEAAAGLVRRVFSRIEILLRYPELGSHIPELPRDSRFRQSVEAPCRIFHRYDKRRDTVYILGVMRGEKLFQSRLLDERNRAKK